MANTSSDNDFLHHLGLHRGIRKGESWYFPQDGHTCATSHGGPVFAEWSRQILAELKKTKDLGIARDGTGRIRLLAVRDSLEQVHVVCGFTGNSWQEAHMKILAQYIRFSSSEAPSKTEPTLLRGRLIGQSSSMNQVYQLIDKVSTSDITVLIRGENGTGKELVAKEIHHGSNRKDKRFVAINCSAFNDNLLDSELFGHVRGAFTGASEVKKGVFEIANGGTLFLDEIGDMSPTLQVKVLRFLQEGSFFPVGAGEEKVTNVRVIAATNRNLQEMVAKELFRQDLYYRINVVRITVPPLRERTEDLPLLCEHFLQKIAARTYQKAKNLPKEIIELFYKHHWPGNVRELENEIERLFVLAGNASTVPIELLSERIKKGSEQSLEKNPLSLPTAFRSIEKKANYRSAIANLRQ